MKNLTIILFLAFVSTSIFSQKEIVFNINHMLNEDPFQLNTESVNNMDNVFTVTRLEYYLSEITLVHDGGQETKLEEFWILARGNKEVNISLGTFDISDLEAVSFAVGVDPDHNHLDPTTYGIMHPLGPKSPSMHWGWTAGYRFVAIEGKSGTNLATTWQLHGLGDDNYFKTTVDITPREENGVLNIDLDADYADALENINLTSGPISHGDSGEAQQCLFNYNDFVFEQSASSTAAFDLPLSNFKLSPNPVSEGNVTIEIPNYISGDIEIIISDVTGKVIKSQTISSNQTTVTLTNPGIYFANLKSENLRFNTQRIVVK